MNTKKILISIVVVIGVLLLTLLAINTIYTRGSFANPDPSLQEVNKDDIDLIRNRITFTSLGGVPNPNIFPNPLYIFDNKQQQLVQIHQSQYSWFLGQVNINPNNKNIVLEAKCIKEIPTLTGKSCDEWQISYIDLVKHTNKKILTSYWKYAIGFDQENAYIIVGRGSGKNRPIDSTTHMFKLLVK